MSLSLLKTHFSIVMNVTSTLTLDTWKYNKTLKNGEPNLSKNLRYDAPAA